MQSFMNLLEYLFSNKKKLAYTTFSDKEYYKVVGELKASGVKYRVSVFSQTPSGGAWESQNREYKIYVKKEDEHKALQAMYHK